MVKSIAIFAIIGIGTRKIGMQGVEMKSSLESALSYLGSFFIGAGILMGFIFLRFYGLGLLVMLVGASLGLIMHGVARVIHLQGEILMAVSGRAATRGDGIPQTEE